MANLQLIGDLSTLRALRRASELITVDLSGNRQVWAGPGWLEHGSAGWAAAGIAGSGHQTPWPCTAPRPGACGSGPPGGLAPTPPHPPLRPAETPTPSRLPLAPCCRLVGNIPSAWADNTVFTKLKTLNLVG